MSIARAGTSPLRIRYMSDPHLEFTDFIPPPLKADIVVLAGDIHTGTEGLDWAARSLPETPVLYLPGNHECCCPISDIPSTGTSFILSLELACSHWQKIEGAMDRLAYLLTPDEDSLSVAASRNNWGKTRIRFTPHPASPKPHRPCTFARYIQEVPQPFQDQ